MSLAHESCLRQLKIVESQIRCTKGTLTWGGDGLSPRNEKFILDLYTIMSCLWFDVSLRPDLLNQRWVRELISKPVDQVVTFLKDLDYELIARSHSVASFNHWRKVTYPAMGQFLAPLADNCTRFLQTGEGLPRLRTAIRYITRANFPEPLGLEEDAFAQWQDVCLREVAPIDVSEEAALIASIFPRQRSVTQVRRFRPKFGPGASAGLTEHALLDKYLSFSDDALLRYVGKFVEYPPEDMPRVNRNGLIRIHHVHFVPKQLDKLRVVSMEPCSLMYYQLGVQSSMVDTFRHSRWKNHIDLADSGLNMNLAMEGSWSGEYATIDLSSASDSVRLWHVQSLFHNTSLRETLLGTRSRQAEYAGEIYTPTYFAPMGSGTCFPVECCVFASIVENVMRRNRDRRAWRVYGDDIICPSDRAEEVMCRLTQLGFTVNWDKSFISQSPGFRESCGGDYYRGQYCRPVYVSRRFKGLNPDPRHPSTIAGLVDAANELHSYKYARCRIIDSLLQVKPGVLFGDSFDGCILSSDPSNFHLKSRWNEELQRMEYKAGSLRAGSIPTSDEYEDIRLYEYLRAHADGSSLASESTTAIGPSRPLKWVAKWQSPSLGWRGDKGLETESGAKSP